MEPRVPGTPGISGRPIGRREFLRATAYLGAASAAGAFLAACGAAATPAPTAAPTAAPTPAPASPAASVPGPLPSAATGRYGGPAPRRIGGTVTLVGGGQGAPGPAFDIRNKYIWEVLREDWDIDVQVVSELDYAQLEVKLRSGQVDFDMVDADGWWAARAAQNGWLAPIDYDVIDASQLVDGAAREFSVLNGVGGHHIAWNTKQRYGEGAGPKSWEEFYNGEMFPGRLAFRSAAFRTLPGAAMGAGIPPASLYPLDLDAAFDTLAKVKDRVVKWSDGSQAHQELVLAGEADLFNLYTSRCVILKRDGSGIDFTFDQGSAEDADMIIMKDSPNREQAMAYLQVWFNTPEAHKAFSELTLLGFTNKLGAEMVDPALKPLLSTSPENAAKFAPAGNDWWAEHSAEAEQRMAEFILG